MSASAAAATAIVINPLSVAKGHAHTCELCSKPARLLCGRCRVTYYCTAHHQSIDATGIHDRICSLLSALRSIRPTLGSSDERQKRAMTISMAYHALIDICKNEAHKFIIANKFHYSIPPALQALRFSILVYGRDRIELVPAYLLLAEATLGMKQLKQCEEYLLYANWSIINNSQSQSQSALSQSPPLCPPSLQSAMYRAFGRLYLEQGRYKQAIESFGQDIYYSALESGPEHIDTANGIFLLGLAFNRLAKIDLSLAAYDKVIDVWYKFAISLSHRRHESISDYLSEAQISEAINNILVIVQCRRQFLGTAHIATGESVFTLALMKHLTAMDKDAKYLYNIAETIYSAVLGADNEATLAIVKARDELPETEQQIAPVMTGFEIDDSETESKASLQTAARCNQESKEELDNHTGRISDSGGRIEIGSGSNTETESDMVEAVNSNLAQLSVRSSSEQSIESNENINDEAEGATAAVVEGSDPNETSAGSDETEAEESSP